METKASTKGGLPTSLLDLGKPSLHGLSYALRHPDTWPEDFYWDYSSCYHCAMGLAHALWHSIPKANAQNGASLMARAFAMPYGAANDIFMGVGDWTPTTKETTGALWWKKTIAVADADAITPEMVADQIDGYLAKAE